MNNTQEDTVVIEYMKAGRAMCSIPMPRQAALALITHYPLAYPMGVIREIPQPPSVSYERFMSVEKELADMTAEFVQAAKALNAKTFAKYCSVCNGAGQVDTGIMESPVTICNACNGIGEAPVQKPIYDPWRNVTPPEQSCYCPNCEALSKELMELKAQPEQPAQPTDARACEVFSQGEWVLYPLTMAAEAKQRGWQVQYLVAEQPAQRKPLTIDQQHARFQAYVKAELGDIAVMDQGRYISPKIHNYWKIWKACNGIKE